MPNSKTLCSYLSINCSNFCWWSYPEFVIIFVKYWISKIQPNLIACRNNKLNSSTCPEIVTVCFCKLRVSLLIERRENASQIFLRSAGLSILSEHTKKFTSHKHTHTATHYYIISHNYNSRNDSIKNKESPTWKTNDPWNIYDWICSRRQKITCDPQKCE